jgi:hypothetical protein
MTKVRICADVPEEFYRRLRDEAERRGVTVESLVEQTVNGLVRELEQEEREGTDHPITP